MDESSGKNQSTAARAVEPIEPSPTNENEGEAKNDTTHKIVEESTTNQADVAVNPNTEGAIEEGGTTATTATLSKSQLKKRRRQEMKEAKKRENKEKKKQARRAKALAEGRDLEEERRVQEERTKSGEGWKRRQEQWLSRMKTADSTFRVCIDCAFEEQMRPKEISSLAEQIRYCYARNKRSQNPCYFSVSSLSENGETWSHLKKVAGFPDQWQARAFQCSNQSLVDVHHPDKDKLVYLSSDSEITLEHLEDDKIYVIGGIVDRNRLPRAAITQAEELGIATAKLPITQYLKLVTTQVLTCNHVFEILLKYREHGNDWKKAMLDVLPTRKDAKPLEVDAEPKDTES